MQFHLREIVRHQQLHQGLEMCGILDQQHPLAVCTRWFARSADLLGAPGSSFDHPIVWRDHHTRHGNFGNRHNGLALTLPLGQPALDRCLRDAPMTSWCFPGLQLTPVHHQLNRTNRHAQHPRHITGTAIHRQRREKTEFHSGEFYHFEKSLL